MSHRFSTAPRRALFRPSVIVIAFAGLSAGPSLAGPHRGGGGMNGMSGGFGGLSAGHMSAIGLAHTNRPEATDRDFGMDRASDRTSARLDAKSMSVTNGIDAIDRDHGRDRAADRAHHHRHSLR